MKTMKTADLLFKKNSQTSKIASVQTGKYGPAGLMSENRPSTVSAAAKYSTLILVLDKLFLGLFQAMESDHCIYCKFEHSGKVYEAVTDKDLTSWLSECPDDYMALLPAFVYTLSTVYDEKGNEEIKETFQALKECMSSPEKRDESKLKKYMLLICDSFYYVYAKNYATIKNTEFELPREIIMKGISNGTFKPMKLFQGLSEGVDLSKLETEELMVEEEEDFSIKYDDWTEEQKLNIPSKDLLNSFVVTDEALSLARKIKFRLDKVLKRMKKGMTGVEAIENDYINCLMVGRPSTGKTTVANAIAAMTGMPIYTVPFSKNTEEDTVEGKNKVVDGKIGFVETDFLKAYEHGGIIVCEEINLADPGVVMGSIGQAIEKPFILMKDGYIPIRRHPLCVIIGTMNTGTAGSRPLNQALSSRFRCTYVLDDPDKETFLKILQSHGHKKENCRYIYDAYTKIIGYLKDPKQSQEDLCENLTLRGCFGALECMDEGQEPKEALKNSLIGKIAEVDLEVSRNVRMNVIDSLPDGPARRRRGTV